MTEHVEYTPKGTIKEFSATSRASVKIPLQGANGIKDNYNIYTFEASATKIIPEGTDPDTVDIRQEFFQLFQELNNAVDDQIIEAESE